MSERRIDLGTVPATAAAAVLRRLETASLACFPTDTVYGLGGAARPEVVAALVAAKGREPDKPLQLIFPTLEVLLARVAPPPLLRAALQRLLPGAITAIIPVSSEHDVAAVVRAADGLLTLGVRVPAWPERARLLATGEQPLVASSANLSGGRAARSLDEVPAGLRAACDLILDAGQLPGTPSTVVDLVDYANGGRWRVIRAGAVSVTDLVAVLGPAD